MNILGMGTLEILVILLIAFIVLGPERMVDAGRLLGKAVREARRFTDELPRISLDEESPEGRPATQRKEDQSANPDSNGDGEKDVAGATNNGPVAFKPIDTPDSPDAEEKP